MRKAKLAIYLSIFSIFAILLIIKSGFAQTTGTSDAIAVRIIPNPNHYSIYRWYDSQGFKGSPQALSVDGYEAVRDGRTVYVNAANVKGKQVYTNIYLISYNQDPSPKTVDILGQIVKFWKFNDGLPETAASPTCSISALACEKNTDCASDQVCATSTIASSSCQMKTPINCSTDDQCPTNFFCSSVKAKIVRDISRIGRTEELKEALYSYKLTNGSYPRLAAGSYLSGQTISVWPSWSETFLPALTKTTNLTDPINRLGACAGYDLKTCWNKDTKRYVYQPAANATFLVLPTGSYGFVYKTDENGSKYSLCAVMETREPTSLLNYQFAPNNPSSSACVTATGIISGGTGANTAPRITNIYLSGEADQEFNGSLRAVDDQDNPFTISMAINSGNYSTWAPAPILKTVPDANQRKIYSLLAGGPGNYPVTFTLSDNLGSSTVTSTSIVIVNPKPLIEADNGEYTLNPLVPLSYSFYYSDNNLGARPTFASTITKQSGPAYDVLGAMVRVVTADGANRYKVTVTGNIPAANKFFNNTDYIYRITASDKYGASTTKDIKLTIKVEAPSIDLNCPSGQRLGSPYSCLLGYAIQGSHNLSYSATNLPAGFSISLATTTAPVAYNNSSWLVKITERFKNIFGIIQTARAATAPPVVYAAYLKGTATTTISQTISIKATNEYGASTTKSFILSINDYCGDSKRQRSNTEGRGGIYNDGYEDCDGAAGLSIRSGKPYVSTSSDMQYGCTTRGGVTPNPIPNSNYCVYKSPLEGGGYCGDGQCQLEINIGTEENPNKVPVENATNCVADCNPTCLASCTGKVCGPDGCGGSCGACSQGKVCNGGACGPEIVCGDNVCSAPTETIASCARDCDRGCCLRPGSVCAGASQEQCGMPPLGYCMWGTVAQFCRPSSNVDCWSLANPTTCGNLSSAAGCSWSPNSFKRECTTVTVVECGDGDCGFGENYSNCPQDCEQTCTPDCVGRNCGDDGCGGQCGICRNGGKCCEADFNCYTSSKYIKQCKAQ